MADLVVKSKVKAYVKKVKKDFRFPDDAVEALDKYVKTAIESAVKRADANGRKTVRAIDF
jgi:histone H3/H4